MIRKSLDAGAGTRAKVAGNGLSCQKLPDQQYECKKKFVEKSVQ